MEKGFGTIENIEPPKHLGEWSREDEEDYRAALKSHEILDKVVENFKPTGHAGKDAELLRTKLEAGGLNFKKMGHREEKQTEEFISKILRLTINHMEDVRDDYRMDTINAMEELADRLSADLPLRQVMDRAA